MKKLLTAVFVAIMVLSLTACGETPTDNSTTTSSGTTDNSATTSSEATQANTASTQNEETQVPFEDKAPLWLQGGGSDFEMQLTTDFVTEMKTASEKVLSVNFITADECYKTVLVISYFDNKYSGYIVNNENGDSYSGDLVFDRDGFVNFRFSSTIYPLFSDITSYSIVFDGEETIYTFENCTGGDFTTATADEPQDDNTVHDTSFLGKEYTWRANFDDGSYKDHTITLSKVDINGNLIEFIYDGYTIELTNPTSEYIGDYVFFSGNCPGHFIAITYTYEYAQSGQNPPDTVYFTTGWGEGRDENMPILIDATFIK